MKVVDGILYTTDMKYIEIIILINVLIHFIFVRIAYFLLKLKMNNITCVISCFLDGIYVLFYLISPYELEKYKYLCITFISVFPFIHKGPTKCLMLMLVYLMLNFTLGGSAGILFSIMNHFSSVIICLGILLFLVCIYAVYKKYHFDPSELEYEVLVL